MTKDDIIRLLQAAMAEVDQLCATDYAILINYIRGLADENAELKAKLEAAQAGGK